MTDLDNFLASHNYSEATKSTYAYVIRELEGQPIRKWGAGELFKFVKRENWGDSMQYVALNACKSFIRWKYGEKHKALSAKIKHVKSKQQRSLNQQQLIQLLAMFDTYTPRGARNQCIVALAADSGLRVAELARVSLANMDLEKRKIEVKTKGGQWEFASYSPETAAIIDRWLSYRNDPNKINTLFMLKTSSIKTLFRRWSKKVGFKISPHDCRRGFAMMSMRNGAPTRIIQEAGRWGEIGMVEHYTRGIEAEAIQPYLPMHNLIK